MSRKRKNYPSEEKVAILRRHLVEQVPVSYLCDELGLNLNVFYGWQKQFFENGTAGKIMEGHSFGLVGNLIVGVIGAVLGGFLFRLVGLLAIGLLGSLISATVGAMVLLFLLQKFGKRV